jgi:hypothetical protein
MSFVRFTTLTALIAHLGNAFSKFVRETLRASGEVGTYSRQATVTAMHAAKDAKQHAEECQQA